MDRGRSRVVGRGRRNGGRARPAGRSRADVGYGPVGDGSARVIGLDTLYGFGGLVAVLLFAYLVFALIRAEAF